MQKASLHSIRLGKTSSCKLIIIKNSMSVMHHCMCCTCTRLIVHVVVHAVAYFMPWHAGSHNYIHVNFSCLVCLSMHALTDYQYTPKQDIRLHRVEGCLHVQTYTINSLIFTTRHNTKDLTILFFIDTEICTIIIMCGNYQIQLNIVPYLSLAIHKSL